MFFFARSGIINAMKMKLDINNDLIDLAKIFKKASAPLYIVGGFVRNALLGFCETDIDVCSKLRPEEIAKILPASKYTLKVVNEKLGTVHIKIKSTGEEYEHTTFRAEQYASGGVHSPSNVRFVDDIPLDASRRDFSANAIYYDILSNEIIDYYNGVGDVKNHVIRTVETPEYVFSCDGLRILRMVRLSAELDFSIDEHTLAVAKSMVSQLRDISQERFNKEFVSVLFADYKYNAIRNPNAYTRGIKQICELGALEYVFPEFTEIVGVERVRSLYSADFIDMLARAQPALRISAFICDICKFLNIKPTKNIVFALLGTGGIMLNKRECFRQFNILSAFFEIAKGDVFSEESARIFIQQNFDYASEIFGLCDIAGIGARLKKTYALMEIDGVPFNLKQLRINGNDIAEVYPKIEKNLYSQILERLLHACAVMPEINRKDLLLREVASIYIELKK